MNSTRQRFNLVKVFISICAIASMSSVNAIEDFDDDWNDNNLFGELADSDQSEISLMQDLEPFLNEPIQPHYLNKSEISNQEGASPIPLEPDAYISEAYISNEDLSSKKRRLSENKEERIYKCNVCGRCYKSNNSLSAHKKGKHSSGFKCDLCEKSFKYLNNLSDHKTATHGNGFECDVKECGKRFRSKVGLKDHTMVAHGSGYKCDFVGCGKRFKSKKGLDQHKRGEHGEGFKCNIEGCGDVVKSIWGLRCHKKSVHGL